MLILSDENFNYCWFYVCAETSVESSSQAVTNWRVAFGIL